MSRSPVRAALFDMDGLLINSEDIYHAVRNAIIAEHGYVGEIPWSMVAKMQSRPGDQNNQAVLDFSGISLPIEQYKARQLELHQEHFPTSQPLPGVESLLHTLKNGVMRPPVLALVSSSQPEGFKSKTTHLARVFDYFPPHLRVLGRDPRIQEGRGKPAPDVFLLALKLINESVSGPKITPEECLVFEDSPAGVQAGHAAGMRVVWVPHSEIRDIYAGHEEDVLKNVSQETLEQWANEARSNAAILLDSSAGPRELANGRIEILPTLQHFDYKRYGFETCNERAA